MKKTVWTHPFPELQKRKKGSVKRMSPSEFLKQAPPTYKYYKPSIEYFRKELGEGKEVEMPYLDYTRMFRGYPTHEGRHRAKSAEELGKKKISVWVRKR